MLFNCMAIQMTFFLAIMIGLILFFFLKFHLNLIRKNKTTIENLEHHKDLDQFRSVYDMGPEVNFYQVFGINRFMWPFPVYLNSGKPLGDGLFWPINISKASDLEDLMISQQLQSGEAPQTPEHVKLTLSEDEKETPVKPCPSQKVIESVDNSMFGQLTNSNTNSIDA